jgi:zinc protease
MNASSTITLLFLATTLAMAQSMKTIVLDSPSELVHIKIMVKAGSAYDPEGLEGLASLTARLMLEGSYGDPKKPVTKEQLADIVRPWGSGAKPTVRVEKETATFSMVVPRSVFSEYVRTVLHPLFTQPLFAQEEIDRLRKETETLINSTLRLENTELLGLYALDSFIHERTRYQHVPVGTIGGLKAITRADIRRFYSSYYVPANLTVGVSAGDADVAGLVQSALATMGRITGVRKFPKQTIEPPAPVSGRSLLIVSQPTTIATGIHAGFPIQVNRNHKDYWALYVANVFFGTHRDGFGRLYDRIRQARGYNYGDYSYIDWFEARPFALFPPTNVPRRYQYFSIWVRPAAHEYAHHLLKAITWELENFVREGMTPEECQLAKNKAKVLYLNLAENSDRLLGYKLDDDFYGLKKGYLDQYLEAIDRLSPEEINAAIRNHLQWKNLKYVIVTNEEWASRLKEDIANNRNAKGKSFTDYNIDSTYVNGERVWQFPLSKIEIVQMDKVWEGVWLDIPADRITVARSTQLFEGKTLIEK